MNPGKVCRHSELKNGIDREETADGFPNTVNERRLVDCHHERWGGGRRGLLMLTVTMRGEGGLVTVNVRWVASQCDERRVP